MFKAELPNNSSTADYQCVFGTHSTKKIMGNYPHWRETIIVPFRQPIPFKILEHSLLGEKTVHEGEFTLELIHLQLELVILSVGNYGSLYLGSIRNLPGVYDLKVEKIHGQIEEEADWIGKIDPYIKFMCFGRELYVTEKVQGAGS